MPPPLSSDSDTPVIPAIYQDVLVWGAVAAISYRERDYFDAPTAINKKELLLKRMQQELMLRQRQTSTHMRRTQRTHSYSR
jgi:hypothetical protein